MKEKMRMLSLVLAVVLAFTSVDLTSLAQGIENAALAVDEQMIEEQVDDEMASTMDELPDEVVSESENSQNEDDQSAPELPEDSQTDDTETVDDISPVEVTEDDALGETDYTVADSEAAYTWDESSPTTITGLNDDYASATSLVIPAKAAKIAKAAFKGNSNLTSLTFEEGSVLTTIGANAFYGTGLKSLTLPDTVTTIDSFAFYNTKITSVVIPEKVTSLADWAFSCGTLTSVTINSNTIKGSGNAVNYGIFYGAPIESITFGNNITKIPAALFRDVEFKADTEIVIPAKVTEIGSGAFRNGNPKEFVIPASVKTIGDNAFTSITATYRVVRNSAAHKWLVDNIAELPEERIVFMEGTNTDTAQKLSAVSVKALPKDLVYTGLAIEPMVATGTAVEATVQTATLALKTTSKVNNKKVTVYTDLMGYKSNSSTKDAAALKEEFESVAYENGTIKSDYKGYAYIYSYVNNVNVGTATVTCVGVNNYTGTKAVTFKIGKTPILMNDQMDKKGNVTAKKNVEVIYGDDTPNEDTLFRIYLSGSYKYVKGGVKPTDITLEMKQGDSYVTIAQAVGKTSYYKCKYSKNSNALDKSAVNNKGVSVAPTVTITGATNFSGSVSIPYTIEKKDLATGTAITVKDVAYSAKVGNYKTTIKITDNDAPAKSAALAAGTDYGKDKEKAPYEAAAIRYTYVDDTLVSLKNGEKVWRYAGDDVEKTTDIIPDGTELRVTVTAKGDESVATNNSKNAKYENYKGTISATYMVGSGEKNR